MGAQPMRRGSGSASSRSGPEYLEANPLLHLVYTSSSPDRYMTRASIEQILATSRRNNSRVGVTGLLLYHDGSFVQFLEGPPAEVEAVYQRICRDERHRGLIEIMRTRASQRSFREWSMAYRDLSDPPLSADEDRRKGRAAKEGLNCLLSDDYKSPLTPDASPQIRSLVRTFHRLLTT
ncbi:BLUF-domain-containing protein [Tilletiopsis washingtonensis]|uniref:BLUF-domain-containing protein n=1 Tax=Tilletiopsis washingtonensis TaxID=58919 RepID=A0A316ZI34_9BASI|nr:BLUF-domain-containing protein [Tilletiopsis washingtonensis]PWO00927.1 BLUF-domain-containing protein [Tilletiopsis washingtonensis]